MKFLPHAIAVASIAATAPTHAQDTAGWLNTMTCRDFLALDAKAQATVKATMLAHVSGEPLPDTPLPTPAEASAGEGGAPGQGQVVEDQTGTDSATGVTAEAAEAPDGQAAGSDGSGTGAPEVLEGENESGKVAPDGTEASITDEAGDRRLVAMRTSCEGGPEARALDGLRAAYGNNI